MRVDSSKIRKKAITDCKRGRTTFEKAERELMEFEETHLPAYTQWLRTGCGPLLEEIKTVEAEVEMLEAQLELIGDFCALMNWSEKRAGELFARDRKEFDRLHAEALEEERKIQEAERAKFQEMRERFERVFFEELQNFLEENFDWVDECGSILGFQEMKAQVVQFLAKDLPFPGDVFLRLLHDPKLDEMFAEAGFSEETFPDPHEDDFGRYFGGGFDEEAEEEFDDQEGEFDPFMAGMTGGPLPPEPEDNTARIKALKREMAFALHPDQAGGDDPKKLALWYEVQAAADDGDLDRLEVLHAHMQVMDGELSPETPVSKLQKITQMYRESRNALRRRIRKLRKEPAWDFTRKTETEKQKILRQNHQVLELEKGEFERELYWVRKRFSRITRPPSHTGPGSAKKCKPAPEPEPLDPRQNTFDFF